LLDLRRTLIIMVQHGFDLTSLRKMYNDELMEYYAELVYVLEEVEKVKKGTYNKIKNIDTTENELKKLATMFKSK